MGDIRKTLRHEVFISATRTGPWESLKEIKEAAVTYVNENQLEGHLTNISESIYAWTREESSGVSRAQVTVWFRYPQDESSPARNDSYKSDLRSQGSHSK